MIATLEEDILMAAALVLPLEGVGAAAAGRETAWNIYE